MEGTEVSWKSDKNFQGHLQDSKIQQLLFPPSRRALASEGAWTQGRPRRPTGSGTPVPWSRKQEEPHGREQILHRRICSLSVRFPLFLLPVGGSACWPPKVSEISLGLGSRALGGNRSIMENRTRIFRVTYKTRKFSNFCSLLQGALASEGAWTQGRPRRPAGSGTLYRGAVNKRNRTEREQILHRRICSLSVRFLRGSTRVPDPAAT